MKNISPSLPGKIFYGLYEWSSKKSICHGQYWLEDINLLRISGLSNGVGHYDEGREDMIDEAIYKSSLMTPHVSLTAEDDKTSTLILPSLAPIVPGIPFILQIWISFTYKFEFD